MSKTAITEGLSLLFSQAGALKQQDRSRWVSLSHKLCGGDIHAAMAIQRVGWLDVFLRCVEDERSGRDTDEGLPEHLLMATHLQSSLSVSWLFDAYEVLRVLVRRSDHLHASAKAVLAKIELVRMPLAKGVVAKTNKPKSEGTAHRPTLMIHIESGSVAWAVLDKEERWHEISRREIADDFLRLSVEVSAA